MKHQPQKKKYNNNSNEIKKIFHRINIINESFSYRYFYCFDIYSKEKKININIQNICFIIVKHVSFDEMFIK